jgi:hypothetical protein
VRHFRFWSGLWTDFPEQAQQLARGPEVIRVCELGGGANPIIPLELIAERGLAHEVADISAEELAKAPAGYRTVQVDAMSPDFAALGPYALIVTAFLAEHLPDPHARLPDALQAHLRRQPTRAGARHRAAPAAHPAAPQARGRPRKVPRPLPVVPRSDTPQISRFERTGFEVLDYVGYFGHEYFRKFGRSTAPSRRSRTRWCAIRFPHSPAAPRSSYAGPGAIRRLDCLAPEGA